MIRWLLTVAVASLAATATADTKHLECKIITDKGVDQIIYATIDDSSDKAEVESFALSAECAKDRSCGIDVYNKEVLPSVLRLTNATSVGSSATYTTVIDIDRTTLSVVMELTRFRGEVAS